jgi:hypothetical protein
MTSPYEVTTFEDFWPHYVRLHTRPETQIFHTIGSLSCIALVFAALVTRNPLLLIAAPLSDYTVSQVSHRLFEKNRTTPWKKQSWHTRAELRMLRLVVTGRMRAEVERHA